MSLVYFPITDDLRVTINHTVADPNNHYIYRVRIWVNGSLVNESLYTSQPSTSQFTYYYHPIIAYTGAWIKVTAYCNQGGSITRSLGQPPDQEIPGFLGLIPIIAFSKLL
jgi:hypothetical protein